MSLHNTPPPDNVLDSYFQRYEDKTVGHYRHILLEAKYDDAHSLAAALRPYFESAHLDARTIFHEEIGINLHPDADPAEPPPVVYPNSLEVSARRGLFGETLAGLLTEVCEYIGGHDWKVPVFLFRFHQTAADYLYTLRRDPSQTRKLPGRTGDDFVAIVLNADGAVVRVLAGEAKWRTTLSKSVVENLVLGTKVKDKKTGKVERKGNGIWTALNKAVDPPRGLKQMQKILKDIAPDEYDAAIHSIDQHVLADTPALPRTNLVVLAGNGAATRKAGVPMISAANHPAEYTSNAELQVVEIIFDKGEEMVDCLYEELWKD